jgi:hypothetical protein
MSTTTSSESEWNECFEGVTRRHYNDPVTVAITGPEIDPGLSARSQPFQGITVDTKGRLHGSVSVLTTTEGGVTEHRIREPRRVVLVRDAAGHDETLAIEGGDGTTTLVRFEESWVGA